MHSSSMVTLLLTEIFTEAVFIISFIVVEGLCNFALLGIMELINNLRSGLMVSLCKLVLKKSVFWGSLWNILGRVGNRTYNSTLALSIIIILACQKHLLILLQLIHITPISLVMVSLNPSCMMLYSTLARLWSIDWWLSICRSYWKSIFRLRHVLWENFLRLLAALVLVPWDRWLSKGLSWRSLFWGATRFFNCAHLLGWLAQLIWLRIGDCGMVLAGFQRGGLLMCLLFLNVGF